MRASFSCVFFFFSPTDCWCLFMGIVVHQLWSSAFGRKHEVCKHWLRSRSWECSVKFFFFSFFEQLGWCHLRDLVPYANSILCILVSFILHRTDNKSTLASDLKGAGARAPPSQTILEEKMLMWRSWAGEVTRSLWLWGRLDVLLSSLKCLWRN